MKTSTKINKGLMVKSDSLAVEWMNEDDDFSGWFAQCFEGNAASLPEIVHALSTIDTDARFEYSLKTMVWRLVNEYWNSTHTVLEIMRLVGEVENDLAKIRWSDESIQRLPKLLNRTPLYVLLMVYYSSDKKYLEVGRQYKLDGYDTCMDMICRYLHKRGIAVFLPTEKDKRFDHFIQLTEECVIT